MANEDPRLRVVFLTHYFPPEVGAPQTRMYELARRLTDIGHQVTVVTAFPNYPTGKIQPGYGGRFAMEENMDGVRVLRRWVFATPNAGFFKRILNHLSFVASSMTAIPSVGPTDAIFVQSPPLPIGMSAVMFSWLRRAPFIFNVSDIWPESAIELGMLRNRQAIWLAKAFEKFVYQRATRITVPTPGILERLAARGVPREKLVWLTNGVDTDIYRPGKPDPELARSLGVNGHKVFIYAGTHGLSQGLDVILEAAKLTRDPEILYLLVGEGADKAALEAKAQNERIENVKFLPNQPRTSVPALLNLAYASIVSLKPLDLFKSALPSKMFESMAVGQPIVASMWGEAADVVRSAGCGLVAAPGDANALRDAVASLAANPDEARRMGESGRAYALEHYDRRKIAQRLDELLKETAARTR